MILDALGLTPAQLHRQTGWELKPEGACKEDRCVPVPGLDTAGGRVDVREFAARLGMPIAHDAAHDLWALGPESGGRVLASARFPELTLSDLNGDTLDFATLRGRKVLLLAWASY